MRHFLRLAAAAACLAACDRPDSFLQARFEAPSDSLYVAPQGLLSGGPAEDRVLYLYSDSIRPTAGDVQLVPAPFLGLFDTPTARDVEARTNTKSLRIDADAGLTFNGRDRSSDLFITFLPDQPAISDIPETLLFSVRGRFEGGAYGIAFGNAFRRWSVGRIVLEDGRARARIGDGADETRAIDLSGEAFRLVVRMERESRLVSVTLETGARSVTWTGSYPGETEGATRRLNELFLVIDNQGGGRSGQLVLDDILLAPPVEIGLGPSRS